MTKDNMTIEEKEALLERLGCKLQTALNLGRSSSHPQVEKLRFEIYNLQNEIEQDCRALAYESRMIAQNTMAQHVKGSK